MGSELDAAEGQLALEREQRHVDVAGITPGVLDLQVEVIVEQRPLDGQVVLRELGLGPRGHRQRDQQTGARDPQ